MIKVIPKNIPVNEFFCKDKENVFVYFCKEVIMIVNDRNSIDVLVIYV